MKQDQLSYRSKHGQNYSPLRKEWLLRHLIVICDAISTRDHIFDAYCRKARVSRVNQNRKDIHHGYENISERKLCKHKCMLSMDVERVLCYRDVWEA